MILPTTLLLAWKRWLSNLDADATLAVEGHELRVTLALSSATNNKDPSPKGTACSTFRSPAKQLFVLESWVAPYRGGGVKNGDIVARHPFVIGHTTHHVHIRAIHRRAMVRAAFGERSQSRDLDCASNFNSPFIKLYYKNVWRDRYRMHTVPQILHAHPA